MTQAEYVAFLTRTCDCEHSNASHCGHDLESELREEILAECQRRGWIVFSNATHVRSTATVGQPDLIVLAHTGKTYLVELKSKTGKLTPEQASLFAWAAKLGHKISLVRSLSDFITLVEAQQTSPMPVS